jgi:hypothetical protein
MSDRFRMSTTALLAVAVLLLGVAVWQLAGLASTLGAVHTDTMHACWATKPTAVPWNVYPRETAGSVPTLDTSGLGPYCP